MKPLIWISFIFSAALALTACSDGGGKKKASSGGNCNSMDVYRDPYTGEYRRYSDNRVVNCGRNARNSCRANVNLEYNGRYWYDIRTGRQVNCFDDGFGYDNFGLGIHDDPICRRNPRDPACFNRGHGRYDRYDRGLGYDRCEEFYGIGARTVIVGGQRFCSSFAPTGWNVTAGSLLWPYSAFSGCNGWNCGFQTRCRTGSTLGGFIGYYVCY